ncbi:MAG: hypothetical protein JNM07_05485 [Phycisphaerae bacterium]|nr:hypothetical protein [Phycisphaerae bacterium]
MTLTRWERFERFTLRASMTATGVSILIHLVLFVIASVIQFGWVGAGTGPGDGGDGFESIVVSEAGGVQDFPDVALAAGDPSVGELASTTLGAGDVGPVVTGEIGSGAIVEVAGAATGMGGAGTGIGESAGGGTGLGAGGAGGGAKFFGVEARGSRFAYLVDVSGSMQHEGKIEALREELLTSVRAMLETTSFFVVFFETDPTPITESMRWLVANADGKRRASSRINDVAARGGTNPGPGFQILFGLRPRPDAIYFMTDGEFDPQVADQVERLNNAGPKKIPVHCICFVSRESEELMRRIATASGGTYTYVPGSRGKP